MMNSLVVKVMNSFVFKVMIQTDEFIGSESDEFISFESEKTDRARVHSVLDQIERRQKACMSATAQCVP